MATTLVRILKYGLQNFVRNGWLSVATIVVLVLAVVVFQGLILFDTFTKNAVLSIQDKIDISVTFKTETPEDEIISLERSLESLAEVKSVEYISRDKALEIFKAKNENNAVISQALGLLEDNPLLAALNIKADKLEHYATIASYLENESFKNSIEKVTYSQSRNAIERLDGIITTFERMGLGLNIFLAIAAALVIFNTIRIAIYANRDELTIMRLVGASNLFIRGPYIVEGVMYGIVAAFVGLLITLPFVAAVAPYSNILIPQFKLDTYVYTNILALLSYQLLFGIGLGGFSSALAVRRYLKT